MYLTEQYTVNLFKFIGAFLFDRKLYKQLEEVCVACLLA